MNATQHKRRRYPREKSTAHDFTSPVDAVFSADFQQDDTGAIHTWQVVKYRDCETWKARNATTRAHRATAGEQRTWGDSRAATQDTDRQLQHVFFRRLTEWEQLNMRRIV